MSSSQKMKFFVSPITHATVQPKVAFDPSESVKVLKHLAKSDSVVIYILLKNLGRMTSPNGSGNECLKENIDTKFVEDDMFIGQLFLE